ncbi:MAG: type IV secretory system conjugative DNA transfer family protein [Oscillospiraceae bacterium]|nr:type IV secretory system conjugative DNA transfer family protein [Oscillospiraceae bacterium]
MESTQILTLCLFGAAFLVIGLIVAIGSTYSLKGIPNKPVGNGQHGTARFATPREISNTYKQIPYTPELWRKGQQLPTVDGLIVGCNESVGGMTALVDDADIHTLMIGASGVGKTANFLYPNIEYCCAAGMSFVTTDSKGDLYRNTATIAEKYYGYKISVIDLRNPTRSSGYNMLYLVNKYMDLYKKEDKLEFKAKAEKFAKITAKTIISADGNISNMGQNAFFYECAEGLITAVILLVAEFCPPEKRHIISVFKLIQDLLAPSSGKGQTQFQRLIELLPSEHKARWFAGAALNSSEQAMASVMSTALSRLNAFLDSELEQILCFDTSIDVEEFCNRKSAIYLVLPEEDATKHFLISLIFQQLYREMLTVADEKGGQLDKRVMFYADEIGTLPKIDGLEMIFSASRSRKISIVAIIQSLAQFEKTYGKEGCEIIVDNCQCTLFGSFAPNSKTAEEMSRNLGKQTILSGSVTKSARADGGSKSLQMIERPLMTVDELKSMPKGHFVVMKTGCHPMRTRLKLFLQWGIRFDKKPYEIPEQSARKVHYADKRELETAIVTRYPPAVPDPVEYREELGDERVRRGARSRSPKVK